MTLLSGRPQSRRAVGLGIYVCAVLKQKLNGFRVAILGGIHQGSFAIGSPGFHIGALVEQQPAYFHVATRSRCHQGR